MWTSPPPLNVEFESDESKLELLSDGILVLPSGNTAIVTEILDTAREDMTGKRPTLLSAAEALRNAYQSVKLEKAEEMIVLPMLGMDFMQSRERLKVSVADYLETQPPIYQMIVGQSAQFNLQTDLLIAGIDSAGGRTAVITHPGSLFWLDKLGYGAVGSGAIHALSTLNLGGQTRSQGLVKTMYNVFRAKKAAEVAPGVGVVTDLGIMDSKGKVRAMEEPVLKELDAAWGKAKVQASPDLGAVEAAYAGSK